MVIKIVSVSGLNISLRHMFHRVLKTWCRVHSIDADFGLSVSFSNNNNAKWLILYTFRDCLEAQPWNWTLLQVICSSFRVWRAEVIQVLVGRLHGENQLLSSQQSSSWTHKQPKLEPGVATSLASLTGELSVVTVPNSWGQGTSLKIEQHYSHSRALPADA